MIKKLLYKEFKLCPVQFILFYILGLLMFYVPTYPKFIGYYYVLLCECLLFIQNAAGNDMLFTASLPITKKDVVKGRFVFFFVINIIYFVAIIPLGLLSNMMTSIMHDSGAYKTFVFNVAFMGLQLGIAGISNFVMLSLVYRKANSKYVLELLLSSLVYFGFIGIGMFLQYMFPDYMLVTDMMSQIKQLPVLCAGIIIFAAGFFCSYKIAVKQFERIDL